MRELEDIIKLHAARYPAMRPGDAVKLIYQNEFGGGHLLKDIDITKVYVRLMEECETTPPNPKAALFERIGNGLVRVNLSALPAHGIAPQMVFRWFCDSAAAVQGSRERFIHKLATLSVLANDGALPFSAEALAQYLSAYAEAGYPAVSHSEKYRRLYAPAYRIVLRQRTEMGSVPAL